jgi:hypothetical protein
MVQNLVRFKVNSVRLGLSENDVDQYHSAVATAETVPKDRRTHRRTHRRTRTNEQTGSHYRRIRPFRSTRNSITGKCWNWNLWKTKGFLNLNKKTEQMRRGNGSPDQLNAKICTQKLYLKCFGTYLT